MRVYWSRVGPILLVSLSERGETPGPHTQRSGHMGTWWEGGNPQASGEAKPAGTSITGFQRKYISVI